MDMIARRHSVSISGNCRLLSNWNRQIIPKDVESRKSPKILVVSNGRPASLNQSTTRIREFIESDLPLNFYEVTTFASDEKRTSSL